MADPTGKTRPDVVDLRLCLREDLRCSLKEAGGEVYYLVEDPLRAHFYHMGSREWLFASLLDGVRTISEAVRDAESLLGDERLSPQEVERLCHWLLRSELATSEASRAGEQKGAENGGGAVKITNPLFVKLPLFNPDRLLHRLLPYTAWLLTVPCLLLWLVVCVWGGLAVCSQWERFTTSFWQILAPGNWCYLLLCWAVLKVLHELFHGLVCKKYGGTVPRCGLMFILFSPVAFVDVTSSWRFGSKWQRVFTSAAGMYVELFVAALAAIVWAHSGPGLSSQLCHNLISTAGIATLLFNGNFLMRFDGYFILSDLTGIRNLYPSGQQYLQYLVRRYLLDVPAQPLAASGRRLTCIKLYAFASLAWRIVFYVGVIALATGMFRGAGIVLAVLAAAGWFGLPAVRFGKYLLLGAGREQPNRLKFGLSLLGVAGVAAMVAQLPCPVGPSAPAVVEYAPLSIVRAETAGTVREVRVRDGERVAAEQVLVVLENPQLCHELTTLELEVEKSVLRGRILRQEEATAKYQVELERRDGLIAKRDELQRQVAALIVRADRTGRVIGRDLSTLVGRYIPPGRELMALGLEDQKELQLSVREADVAAFGEGQVNGLRVRLKGGGRTVRGARLVRINPQATRKLIHPALGAPLGGPLTVAQRSDAETTAGSEEPAYELVEARFTAHVALPERESQRVWAGELARVSIAGSETTVGAKLYETFRAFLKSKLGQTAG